jgi:phosphatidylserine decarboxylase
LIENMVRDGYFYGFGFIAAAVLIFLVTGHWAWAVVPILLACFFLWFFRDPKRPVPAEAGLVVSPADGKITEVTRIQTPAGERIRLSIFLSVFDVHVNRSPIAGTVREVRYQKGQHLNALSRHCAEKNEQNIVTVQGDEFDVTFSQIAGILARRIVFRFKVGDFVERGERVGLIKFGSRVDVILPGHAHVRVALGHRVKGGASVLADIHPPQDEPSLDVLQESFA